MDAGTTPSIFRDPLLRETQTSQTFCGAAVALPVFVGYLRRSHVTFMGAVQARLQGKSIELDYPTGKTIGPHHHLLEDSIPP